ncbi:HAD family hydrolase [Tsukamurella sp. 8F]|uniref:HAD family hydrolase n=1 Tax=unclassified Tsukamurella TaxID=2633480 RepID=UPI0023B950B7|nr:MULTISPECIES: HAD family hydrolase [unclassified Tsukamurella]MDF0530440.1 HAD family hydrolase [Tsukamurella sp. 8J]MDF0587739.1 HAD family hydrolase [Tsukamurella sp. 8F]
MKNTLVTSDLDRTLIYSRSAGGEAFARHETVCVEMYDGSPLSHMTLRSREILAALQEHAELVPVTTRTPEQYGRVVLPGSGSRYAIASNGGAVLVDGERDPVWRGAVDALVAELPASLEDIVDRLGPLTEGWARLRVADGLFCYLVADHPPAHFVDRWRGHCVPLGWDVSQQGRKIYTVPRPATKEAAIAEVRRRLISEGRLAADARVLAAGDGMLDLGMLRAADAAIRPRHGELEAAGVTYDGLAVTAGAGLGAGEEIARWFQINCTTVLPDEGVRACPL